MDLGLLIATAVGSVAAIVAAFVAVVQASRAKASEKDAVKARIDAEAARDESVRLARTATDAFIRQAEAQEKANAIKEAEMAPEPWAGPRWVSGDLFRFTNTTGRVVKLKDIDVEPKEAENRVQFVAGAEDGIYPVGHSFELIYSMRGRISPRGLTLNWRYVDEPESALRGFVIPL